MNILNKQLQKKKTKKPKKYYEKTTKGKKLYIINDDYFKRFS